MYVNMRFVCVDRVCVCSGRKNIAKIQEAAEDEKEARMRQSRIVCICPSNAF